MNPLRTLNSKVVQLLRADIDTDQIIPARFLKVTQKSGLGKHLFADWRHSEDGSLRSDFALNKPENFGREILLAGDNFGCGSSREHAPWALSDWGIRAVISTGFADIFRRNALENGLLPIEVNAAAHERLRTVLERDSSAEVQVDVEAQTLSFPGTEGLSFPVDPFGKHRLLRGLSSLDYLLEFEEEVQRYEARMF